MEAMIDSRAESLHDLPQFDALDIAFWVECDGMYFFPYLAIKFFSEQDFLNRFEDLNVEVATAKTHVREAASHKSTCDKLYKNLNNQVCFSFLAVHLILVSAVQHLLQQEQHRSQDG